ncbi:hypothetical protein FOA43_001721 [Brettanomyces nanus]|uniref:Exocyst complex component Sec3 PIP2-binding N-terminal domain-containing protein n=1 Tax=Eeniella nana TaxID=13502 RepID=A0A875S5A6_EENNA|nr:uncharacterized protein FOA43_001721 [Brettanomyces nanus]QPG74394.1 hypothetical protein FOA43_001721 [Brettanomyces nanus]
MALPGHKHTGSSDLAFQYERDIHQIEKFLFRERDDQGRRLEKYLAHVRVVEDSRSPNQRPPENSAPNNKKYRLLVLTVKISGRMRMHKARESPDGLIQIGRTWDFDQLSLIDIDEDVPTGFAFTMGKRYYWETHSPKERRVWLTTVLEHFIRYTKGGVPELVNCSVQYFHLDGLLASVKGKHSVSQQKYRSIPAALAPTASTTSSGSETAPSTGVQKSASVPIPMIVPASVSGSTRSPVKKGHPSLHFGHSRNVSVSSNNSEEGGKRRSLLLPFRRASSKRKQAEKEAEKEKDKDLADKERQEQLRKQVLQEKERQMKIQQEDTQAELHRQKQLEIERERELLQKRGKVMNETERYADNDNSLDRKKSIASSVEDGSLDNSENENDYDFLEDYAENESLEDNIVEPHTAPLRLSEPGVVPADMVGDSSDGRSIDETLPNSRYRSVEDTSDLPDDIKQLVSPVQDDGDSDLEANDEEPEMPLALEATDSKLAVPIINATLQPPERLHARSRAFSRVEEEKKDNDFSDLFEEIGYDPMVDDYSSLEKKLHKELERLQYDKINAATEMAGASTSLKKSMEDALGECAKIDAGLSLFGVQLSGFQENVSYIEKQGHGLQVETTNKKLLKKELKEILFSVDIGEDKLRYLLSFKVSLNQDTTKIEQVLDQLYGSLMKMKGTSSQDRADLLSNMKALREKRAKLENVSQTFVANLRKDIKKIFKSVSLSLTSKLQSLRAEDFLTTFFRPVLVRKVSSLLALSGILAFVKRVSPDDFNEILAMFSEIFQDFYTNLGDKFLKQFNAQLSQISFSPFEFNSAPKDFIDQSCMKMKNGITTKSRKTGSNKILEELGLSSPSNTANDAFDLVTSDENSSNGSEDFASNAMLSNLLISCMNVMALQQELFTELFSLSSSSDSQFQSLIKVPMEQRISNFANMGDFLGGAVETDREISDSIYEIMKSMFGGVINDLFKALLSIAKQNILQPPSILLLLQNLSLSVASTNQEYVYSRFTKLESRIRTIWERQSEEQTQIILNTDVFCRVMNFSKAFPVYFRKVEQNLVSLKTENLSQLPIHQKLVGTSEHFWGVITRTLIRGVENISDDSLKGISVAFPAAVTTIDAVADTSSSTIELNSMRTSDNMYKHLALLLNYKWMVDQMKDLSLIPSSIKREADESRSRELGVFTDQLSKRHSIGELVRFVNGLEGLIKTNTDPSKTNSYSAQNLKKLLERFKGNNLKVNIKELASDLHQELSGKCCREGSVEQENSYSLAVSKAIENDLFNNCMSSLSVLYTTTFSKLNPIIKQYYEGVTNPVDKILISFNFNKEFIN